MNLAGEEKKQQQKIPFPLLKQVEWQQQQKQKQNETKINFFSVSKQASFLVIYKNQLILRLFHQEEILNECLALFFKGPSRWM